MIARFGCRSALLVPSMLLGVLAACEKVPLLAPTGSTITLNTAINVLPINGTTEITAQVIESSGFPPHSGTDVSFLTTLGKVEPAHAPTDANGRVVVKFLAGGSNGTASITAMSGGASTGASGAIKIAIGTAAVGNVTLSANPSVIQANGGSSTITAFVVDINSNPLVNAPVRFSTSAGSLSSGLANTNQSGVAETVLTTTTQAMVTATVGVQGTGSGGGSSGGGSSAGGSSGGGSSGGGGSGGSTSGQASATVTVTVNPLPTVSISAPGGTLTAGSPITFTIKVQPGTNSVAQIKDVSVNFGDGPSLSLGAVTGDSLTVQHTYTNESLTMYTVRVTVLDSLGANVQAATIIEVFPQPPLTVFLTKASQPSGDNIIYTLTASVSPSSVTVSRYLWTRDGGATILQDGPSNVLIQTFPKTEVHTITVEITTTTGQRSSTSIVVP